MKEIARVEQSLEPPASASAQTERVPRNQIPEQVFRDGEYLPCHYFDFIAGTGIGGLVAIMLGMLEKSVDECISDLSETALGEELDRVDGLIAQNIQIMRSFTHSDQLLNPPELPKVLTWPTDPANRFFETFANFKVPSDARTPTDASLQEFPATRRFVKSSRQCQSFV